MRCPFAILRPTYLDRLVDIRRLPLLAVLGVVAAALFIAFRREPAGVPSPRAESRDAAHLVAILQYLESDYPPAVASRDAGELAEQRSLAAEAAAIAARLPLDPAVASRAASIEARVRQGVDPASVSVDCASLVDDLVVRASLARGPSVPPNLEEGARLYGLVCASCHGASGRGDGPAAAPLTPKPANFHSPEVIAALTPFKAFNVIRFGVKGTAMVSFDALDENQRWALAFYVFALRQPPCDHTPAPLPLEDLANRTDGELQAALGEREAACERRNLPKLDPPMLLGAARARLEEASRLVRRGDDPAAESVVLDAYLTDIEPIEPWLRARDPEAVAQLEASFTATRAAVHNGDPAAVEEVTRLEGLLDRAAGKRGAATKVSMFWFSVFVIVREGFEAAVIIAALLAVLKKRKQVSRARWVHAGWISAIAVGAAVFIVGRRVLVGALNEKIEGCLAFVAVAMLLQAALWLNARTTTRRTMGTLRDRTQTALDGGAVALFGIAFLAMFRESFETAVFLEALSIDAPAAVAWGALSGGALLLGLVLAVSRLGLRLPMQALFRASTVVLIVTAVMLLGQGIHSFEEVGLLSARPVRFLRIEFLGIYPDLVGLLAQLVLSVTALTWQQIAARLERPASAG